MIYVIIGLVLAVVVLGFWLAHLVREIRQKDAEYKKVLEELRMKEDSLRLLKEWQKEHKEIKDAETQKAAEIAGAENDEEIMDSVRDIVARNNERVQNDKKRNSAAAHSGKDGAAGAGEPERPGASS